MIELAAPGALAGGTGPALARADLSSTFADNARLPVHRWFRFSAGFSGAWAQELIERSGARRVLDPFAGSGTTLIAAEDAGAEALGVEAHPFVRRVAAAKLERRSDADAYLRRAHAIAARASREHGSAAEYPALVRRCYPEPTLAELDALRAAVESERDDSPAAALAWLTLVGILRACSPVGTAQWQYVLPRKEKKRPLAPLQAFAALAEIVARDMRQTRAGTPAARVLSGDARDLRDVPDAWAELVVTSPPYPNNYDYADATRLEMSFFREITAWSDLQHAVRRFLVRACSQHVTERSTDLARVLAAPELAPIRSPLASVCAELESVRRERRGRKTYHLMVACYFQDLAQAWLALRRTCAPGARVCLVIGDSAPYGVYVPAMEWLGALALAAGFRGWNFERTRERNVKWLNRKHRVPLCEGRLWVQG